MLSFYLTETHPTHSECDIDSNVKYTLNSYILFSISVLFVNTIIQMLSYNYLKNRIVINVIIFTIFYSLIIIIALGGIFIAQQMNENSDCYKFFKDNKNIFSIFISILFLTLINIIYKSYTCKNPESLYRDDESRPLLVNM
jgi:hypothetical protein